MYWTKEYADTLTVSLQNLRDMQKAQYDMWNDGFEEQNFSKLSSDLGLVQRFRNKIPVKNLFLQEFLYFTSS